MARFRAYTSDSSSDDEPLSEEEKIPEEAPELPEEDSDDDSSSSTSSDLREEELITRPRPRNGLVEDENGDIQYAHEVSRPRADPTLIPWAQHIGVDAQKMHVMQTSLFRVPEEAAAMRAAENSARAHLQVPQPLNRKHSRDSDGDGLRFESKERASFAHDIEPAYRPSRKYARVESSESAVTGNEAALVDAGLAFGRSFRVGWGPDGTLVHLGSLCAPSTSIKTSANSSIISKTKAPISASDLSVKLLQHQLSHSPIDFDDDDIPFANPSSTDLHFSSFATLFPPTDHSFEASLFRLGSALFDSLNLRLGDSVTPDIRARISALRRKAALSAWLEDAVAPSVDADIRANPAAGPAALTFMHLTGNQVDRASEVAMDGGYLKLATLISQAGGDFEFREDLKEQLEIWREQRIDVHIDENVRKLYALLAGIVDSVVEGSKGSGQDNCADVDIVAGLDWKRVFGLHLWFSGHVDAPVAQVFDAYNRLVKESTRKVPGPIPWYEEASTTSKWRWRLPSPPSAPDALFSMIRLHADPSCSLSHVLTPLSFGPSPLDYSLPWHLYIILSRCMRIRDFADRGDPGIRRISPSSSRDDGEEPGVEGHSPSADLLTSSYAFQLEQQNRLQEAVFVLLHLEGSAGREKAIKEFLARCAPRLDEWSTRGIIGSLRVPMAWIQEAKATSALYSNQVFEAYELYLSAGLYNAAHDIAVLKLAPDAVIRNDLTLLTSLFSRFNGRPVDGWHVRGKAFLDFAHIVTRLPELEEELGQEQELDIITSLEEEMDELTRNASKLIGILPDALRDRADPRHNAALAHMIRVLVKIVDKFRPFTLAEVQPTHVDEAVKLQHIQSSVYARFLKSIDHSA
ncbi:nuclear protein 96-domain-containing protein [Mycena polygramma]|nr:nuclear protein 96-domain-containing protein [Mycena polygramma]